MTQPITVQTPPCPRCGKPSTLTVDDEAFETWRSGTLIQNAFPDMSADDRELLITGYHGKCWDLDFGYISEDEE